MSIFTFTFTFTFTYTDTAWVPLEFSVACPFLELPQGAAVADNTNPVTLVNVDMRGWAAFNRGSPQISVGLLSGKPT